MNRGLNILIRDLIDPMGPSKNHNYKPYPISKCGRLNSKKLKGNPQSTICGRKNLEG